MQATTDRPAGFPTPPEDLIYRVAGTPDPEWFHKSGNLSMQDIGRALARVNRSLADFSRILDFGCGCGRILSWMQQAVAPERICGVDIDDAAISWLKPNLPGVEVHCSNPLPPLPFHDGEFDLVYSHSVFTHLDVNYQDEWLRELLRITRPGAILLLSFSGRHAFGKLEELWRNAGADPTGMSRQRLGDGTLFITDDDWKNGPFPDFYHTMFHTESYVFRHWGELFRVHDHIPQGSLGYQDFVVLEHPVEMQAAVVDPLPLPPEQMRALVGNIDPVQYDNPSRSLVYPEIPAHLYDSVLDFGCGCGRVARQLLQQQVRPRIYVGVDIHRGMIDWCEQNLAPQAANFRFVHHDVYNLGLAPDNSKQLTAALPADPGAFTFVNAHSVFTHLYKQQSEFYLREIARALTPDGVARTTWFFFDRAGFPFLVDEQMCLFVNEVDPTNAVIYDREWFLAAVREAGLSVRKTNPPNVPGHQWEVFLDKRRDDSVDRFPLGADCADSLCGAVVGRPRHAAAPPAVETADVNALRSENQELKLLVAELSLELRRKRG